MRLQPCAYCAQEYTLEDKIHTRLRYEHSCGLRADFVKFCRHRFVVCLSLVTRTAPIQQQSAEWGRKRIGQGAKSSREETLRNTNNYFDAWDLAGPRQHGNRVLSAQYNLEFGG